MKIMKMMATLFLSFGLLLTSPLFASEGVISSVTDGVNSGIINTKLTTSSVLSHTDVSATVTNSIAIFSGQVNSRAQLSELIRIGHSVSGIRGVDVSRVRIVNPSR